MFYENKTTHRGIDEMIKFGSMFSQILSYVDRIEFERMVRRHHADRGEKGFTCWNHFVSMLFCQLAQAKSIREICCGLAITLGKLKHPEFPSYCNETGGVTPSLA